MAKRNLKDLDMKELFRIRNVIRSLIYVLLVMLLAYAIYMIYHMANGSWDPGASIITIPLILLFMSILTGRYYGRILAEINSRVKLPEE